jgi:hypothetical protein
MDTIEGIALHAGENVLIFKVINGGYDWEGSIRLTDARGNSVGEIQVKLAPDG